MPGDNEFDLDAPGPSITLADIEETIHEVYEPWTTVEDDGTIYEITNSNKACGCSRLEYCRMCDPNRFAGE
jgi:hypothetical protein